MRKLTTVIVAALAVSLAAPAFAATAAKKDPQAEAQKRLEAWQTAKRDCYTKAGLKEGVTFRVNPANALNFQVSDKVWLQPDKFDTKAVKACVKL